MTIVRIVLADPRSGQVPGGSVVNGQQLIALADDAGHRAVPLWLGVVGAKLLLALLKRPAGDAAMPGVLEEMAAALLDVAGVGVAAVDIEPASEDVPELRSDTTWVRVGLATAAGTRHVIVSAEYGLKLAVAAGAPVRVADAVMDRLAVPVGEDVLAPFLPALDCPAAGRAHWQDYSCAAADQSAVLTSAVPEPSGSAVLFQEIFGEDYRGRTVTFRGRLRTTGVAGHAGLHLAAGRAFDAPAAHLRDRGGSSLTGPGSSGWTWHEVTMPVPREAGVVRFGISLIGRGRVELRNPELSTARPGTQE